jgi:hypothetical protein
MQLIYVHLSKCGGTSIENRLYEHSRWNDVSIGGSIIGELIQAEYSRALASTSTVQQPRSPA